MSASKPRIDDKLWDFPEPDQPDAPMSPIDHTETNIKRQDSSMRLWRKRPKRIKVFASALLQLNRQEHKCKEWGKLLYVSVCLSLELTTLPISADMSQDCVKLENHSNLSSFKQSLFEPFNEKINDLKNQQSCTLNKKTRL